jgi:glycosyltransferase involved in cell wall biosynthesis
MISVVLPTFNGEKYISRAIDSVLSQSFSDFELIIINDGGNDNTESIIKGYSYSDSRIKYFKNEKNLGIVKSLNRGLNEAKGDYIARIDDDDVWIDKDKLKKQFEFLENNPGYVLVGTGAICVDENEIELTRYLLPGTDEKIREDLLCKNNFIHSSVMYKKDAVIKVGGYDEKKDTKYVEDYDLWLRLGIVGKMHNLREYSILYMIREGSVSSQNRVNQLKKDIKLSKKYKRQYSNYFRALIIGYARVVFYAVLVKIPIIRVPFLALKNRIFKLYKEF